MSVLLVSRAIPLHPNTGGMETALWDLAKELSKTESVTVLTTPVMAFARRFEVEGVQVATVRGARPGRYSLRWWIGSALYDLSQVDVVISISAGATALILFRPGPLYIFQAHGTAIAELHAILRSRPRLWPLRAARLAWWTIVDRASYRKADAIVSIGPSVTEKLKRAACGDDSHRVHEIPNGVSQRRATGRAPHERTKAIYVGRLVDQKGVDRLIQAVVGADAELEIVGGGPARDELARLAIELGVEDQVHFVGEVPQRQIWQYLQGSDVLLFTPRNIEREGLPMTVLEALAVGTPVATYESSIWPDDIRAELKIIGNAPGDITAVIRASSSLPTPTLPSAYDMSTTTNRWLRLISSLRASGARSNRRRARAKAEEL